MFLLSQSEYFKPLHAQTNEGEKDGYFAGTLITCFSCSHQDINGEVQDLSQLAGKFEYVASGCGKACENNACKNNGKCLDNYNVYFCDCSKTPFYGYFCHQGKLCCVRVLC